MEHLPVSIEAAQQSEMNLNSLSIPKQFGPPEPLADHSCSVREVEVRFRHLQERLVELISRSQVVVGCVAWLTSTAILDALALTQGVSIVVQKEDFLRPDLGETDGWKQTLRDRYERLPALHRLQFDSVLKQMSWCSDPRMSPVRCVGNYNRTKRPAFPRCHHKFIVFCDFIPGEYGEQLRPLGVWTGSFNFTRNAIVSLENALYITNTKIATAYFKEYCQIVAISEPLDWTSDWCEPEWRIGT